MPAGNPKPSIHTQTAIFHCEECTRALFGLVPTTASNGHEADSFRVYKNFFSNVFISLVLFFFVRPLRFIYAHWTCSICSKASAAAIFVYIVSPFNEFIVFYFDLSLWLSFVSFFLFLYSLSSLLRFMLADGVLAMDAAATAVQLLHAPASNHWIAMKFIHFPLALNDSNVCNVCVWFVFM